MTIEEMIALLGQYAYADKIKKRGNGRFEAIIAALKAGQEMRNGIDKDDTGVYATDYNILEDGAEAWDEATKENVCGELK